MTPLNLPNFTKRMFLSPENECHLPQVFFCQNELIKSDVGLYKMMEYRSVVVDQKSVDIFRRKTLRLSPQSSILGLFLIKSKRYKFFQIFLFLWSNFKIWSIFDLVLATEIESKLSIKSYDQIFLEVNKSLKCISSDANFMLRLGPIVIWSDNERGKFQRLRPLDYQKMDRTLSSIY